MFLPTFADRSPDQSREPVESRADGQHADAHDAFLDFLCIARQLEQPFLQDGKVLDFEMPPRVLSIDWVMASSPTRLTSLSTFSVSTRMEASAFCSF